MRLAIHQFPYYDDNYGVLLHDAERGATALVDAGDADAAEGAVHVFAKGVPAEEVATDLHVGDVEPYEGVPVARVGVDRIARSELTDLLVCEELFDVGHPGLPRRSS